MKKLKFLSSYAGMSFAFLALAVAQVASVRFSVILYQDAVLEKSRLFESRMDIFRMCRDNDKMLCF